MQKTIKVEANEVFREVDACTKRYIIMKGSAGSGKSVDTAQHYIVRLMQQKGRNLLALRKSEVTNRDSTFAELASAIVRLGVEDSWKIVTNPMSMRCFNGNRIIFRGMNDEHQREKLKSITFANGSLTDIWLEEATEFSREDVEILDDRLRGKLAEGLFYQMRLTFNPVSVNHWIKKAYFDIEDEQVFTHHSTYLNNRFVDDAFHVRMERRRKINPEGYRVYGLGEWGLCEEQILTNWDVGDVCKVHEDYDGVFIGQDFGFNHANALLVIGFKDEDIFILEEIYEKNRDTSELIAIANAKGISKQRVMYCDSAEPDRILMWRKAGYLARAVSKEPGSVQAQIDFLKSRKIVVDKECKNTIDEMREWRWQRDAVSGNLLDIPLSVKDDAMAALRYAVEGMRKSRRIEGIKL